MPSYPRYVPPVYDPHHRPDPTVDAKQASWALGLAFVPAGVTLIAAVVLAIKALRAIGRGEARGKKRAIAALVVVAGWIGVFVLAAVIDVAERDDDGTISSSGTLSVVDVKEGDCLNVGADSEVVRTVEATPCSTDHQWEAYATFPLPDGDYPGEGVVQRAADNGCLEQARTFLGTSPRKAGVTVVPLTPLEQSWAMGDHSVTCLVGYDGRSTTGSLQGVGAADDAVTT
jgi:hypothetical protein